MNTDFHLLEAIILSIVFGVFCNFLLFKITNKYYRPVVATPLSIILSALKRAFYLILPLILFSILTNFFELSRTSEYVEILVKVLITTAFALAAIKLLDYIDIWLDHKKHSTEGTTPIGMIITRTYLLKKILMTVISFIAIALILLNFPAVKELGKGILISAGLIGGIIAFAAQKIFSNVFSGMELILNKPIKVGDMVAIKDELGTIEKITLNQIHLRTWDLRLVVYPLNYFNENPFQNLSCVQESLIGIVYLYTNFNVDLNILRQVLTSILSSTVSWDQQTNILQMTEVNENSIQLRALVSAKDAKTLWNLRCEVREKMIKYMQSHCQEILPKRQIQIDNITKDTRISEII